MRLMAAVEGNKYECLLHRQAIVALILIFVIVTCWRMWQCVVGKVLCNKQQNCRDSSDEEMCSNYGAMTYRNIHRDTFPPAVIHMDGQGDYSIQPLASFSLCPHTHFLCQGQSLCVHTLTSCVHVSLSVSTHPVHVSW